MKQLLLFLTIVFIGSTNAQSQTSRFAPFEVDTVQNIAKLNIQAKELSKKFLATFAAQKLNANFAADWQKVVEQIVAVKLPDLSENGDITIDGEDYILEITAPDMMQLQKVIKAVKPYLASPGKMESFFNEPAKPAPQRAPKANKQDRDEGDD